MITIISYEDYKGNPVDSKPKSGDIVHRVDGKVKLIETVEYHTVIRYTYYLSDNEDIMDIIDKYSNQYIDIYKRTPLDKYWLVECTTYDNSELYVFQKEIEDQSGETLCEEEYDIVNTVPVLKKITKFLDKYNDGDDSYIFNYDKEGEISEVSYRNSTEKRYQNFSAKDLIDAFPNILNEYPYYQNAEPLPIDLR